MKNRKSLLSAIVISVSVYALTGCSAEETLSMDNAGQTVCVNGREFPADAYVPGLVQVKVSESFSKNIETGLCELVPELDIIKVERTFPYAGEFEARTVEAGLHLWYDVYFAGEKPLSRAGESIASVDGILHMEYRPKTIMSDAQVVKVMPKGAESKANSAAQLFDDDLLGEQWHYYNDGSISDNAIAGSDINVLPVWKQGIVGNPDVIVVVTDGGVDIEHEDLKDNIWEGTDENGNTIHGYDFFNDDYTIEASDHATHIAGTIAAVNNNGKGVCGIAGGDKANNVPGVKIMTCQISSQTEAGSYGYKAIKWAADHGAVISQNSWGYPSDKYSEIPQVDKEAIDYFIRNAGYDKDGNQVGPMAGGVVIFAAGNEAKDNAYPQMYPEVIAVSASTSDFGIASYSNFGSWVDVAAPGGDDIGGVISDGILSTLPDNEYGIMIGTSMACPHVSGLAALIVSKHGGVGFTNEDLKKRLLMNVTSIHGYNEDISGLYGSGLVNAEFAIDGIKENGADAVTDLSLEAHAEKIEVSFTVPGGKKVKSAYIHYSENEFTAENIGTAKKLVVSLGGFKAGDTFTGTIDTREFQKKYYVAVSTLTENNEMSAVSDIVSIVTGENSAPVIEALDGVDITVEKKVKAKFRFIVKDADGHKIKPSVSPNYQYISIDYKSGCDTLYLNFEVKTGKVGTVDVKLIAKDEYDLSTELPLTVNILEESVPDEPEEPGEPGEDEPEPPVDDEPVTDTGKALTFYPNPVVDNLYIRTNDGNAEGSVTIYSSAGAVVYDEDMEIGAGPIDMSGYPAGVYTVKVIYKDKEITGSIVKI